MNSPQKAPTKPTIKSWTDTAASQLEILGIKTARLDSEIILAHTLRQPRTYLHAHPDDQISRRDQEILDARLALRLDHVPIAYIIGHKEFYGRRFRVTTATLIPRPESEDMITVLKDLLPNNLSLLDTPKMRLVDVGTGSGCLGITAELEIPELDVTLVDNSRHALVVATANSKALNAEVAITYSDLLANYPFRADIILANLPYVDRSWERSKETDHEPQEALFAADGGMALIKKLVIQAKTTLTPGGYLILEADPTQHGALITYARQHELRSVKQQDYILALQKI